MPVSEILYTLLIGPLEALFEVIYVSANKFLENPGLAIIVLSFVMNMLLLPLYRRTDAIQEEAIETEKRMKPYIDHFKKTFKGDERFMMIQTCYRQHHYKPADALKGLTPLVLEIPFFMAAYNFLSGLELLQNVSFGPIADLGAPDGLLNIGGLSINLLPILMTLINLVSSFIYTRQAPTKTKVQLYGMAALFLVLLYDSPAGLAFYWTLNNLFSLVKNALMKAPSPMKVLAWIASPVSLPVLALAFRGNPGPYRIALFVLAFLFLNVPLAVVFLQKHRRENRPAPQASRADFFRFLCGGILMTVLMGITIPSALIHSSPEEFIILGLGINPLANNLSGSVLLAAGFFLVWAVLFYALANPRWKKNMELGMWILCAAAVADYMFFGNDYGTMSNRLVFDIPIEVGAKAVLLNLAVIAAVAAVVILILRKKPAILNTVGIAVLAALIGMSAFNISTSQKIISDKMEQLAGTGHSTGELFHLSREGQNVVVLMLDRAVGAYLPYILNEVPELQEQFAGFTYYPNTLSFGAYTNFGLPSVFGGYEYTPLELNRRDTVSLADKHNEALKVMPVLFQEQAFDVTVCDPTYAGYDVIPDLSIYSDYPEIKTHITMQQYVRDKDGLAKELRRRTFFYSVLKASPTALHSFLYDEGRYLSSRKVSSQVCSSTLTAEGLDPVFDASINVLENLPAITAVTDNSGNTFQMMCNEASHSPVLLQMPDYTFTEHVDNTAFDEEQPVRSDGAGHTLVLHDLYEVTHYHCNASTFIQVGKWLDYLRENGVYDNTRIILVSDHARDLGVLPTLDCGGGYSEDLSYFNPLLMVKDFGSTQFRTDSSLMTNADVPSLAVSGLIEDPVNPFTGKSLMSADHLQEPLYILDSHIFDVLTNNGNTFKPDRWLSFSGGDIHDVRNWAYAGKGILPQGQ